MVILLNKPENPFQSYDGAKKALKIKAHLEQETLLKKRQFTEK